MPSFFSTLFGGGAEREAADRNRGEIGNYQRNAFGAFDTGLNRSVGAVTDANNSAGRYLANNYDLYGDLRTAGTGILDRGRADSLTALRAAGDAYTPLANLGAEYGRGREMYQNSIGLNGAAGNTTATNAFQAGPGYQFTLDQGLNALNRRRAAAGMLNSGNADIDALTYGTGLANQTYGAWQDRLAGFVPLELQATTGAATGRAGIGRDMANVIGADTAARLGLESGVTQGQAGVNTARAANDIALGNTLTGLYTGDANNRVGVFGNVLSGNTSANNMQAQGEAAGARNLWGAGMQVAGLAAGALGGGMGGGLGSFGGTGSTAGSFGNLFGSGGTLWGNGTGYAVNPTSPGGQLDRWAYSRAA